MMRHERQPYLRLAAIEVQTQGLVTLPFLFALKLDKKV